MRYSTESDGSRRFKLTSDREVVSRKDGNDYYVDHVESKIGMFATVRGHVFRPVHSPENPDDRLKIVNTNGFMATSAVYNEVAAEMASMGATTATYDTWHPLTQKDYKDPVIVASMGGHAMIDIMEDISEERTDVAVIGHSMGGLSSSRLAAFDHRVGYWVGDASAGIEHEDMLKVHIDNMREILSEEALPLGKQIVKKIGGRALAKEYLQRIALNPTQIARQAILLCRNPDITPYLATAKERGVMNGVILHEHDAFFHLQKQLDVIATKQHLFDVVKPVEGTKHVHSNMHPHENAVIRMEVVRALQSQKLASKVLTAVG